MDYLERREADHLYFTFRWLIINFKREYSVADVRILWEVPFAYDITSLHVVLAFDARCTGM